MSDIKTKPATDAYREGWDRNFARAWEADRDPLCKHCGRKRVACPCLTEEHGERSGVLE